jgi:hypothetical protein
MSHKKAQGEDMPQIGTESAKRLVNFLMHSFCDFVTDPGFGDL